MKSVEMLVTTLNSSDVISLGLTQLVIEMEQKRFRCNNEINIASKSSD
jgi:hypothetical protein